MRLSRYNRTSQAFVLRFAKDRGAFPPIQHARPRTVQGVDPLVNNLQTTRLAIIIVNYNTVEQLHGCLSSLRSSLARALPWPATDIVVVDNASSDGSAAMVARDFPEVHLVALTDNLGFTGGNNRALEMLGLLGTQPILPRPDFVSPA